MIAGLILLLITGILLFLIIYLKFCYAGRQRRQSQKQKDNLSR